jgi:hypothetical protein
MVIALGADIFFWVVGEIGCSCSLGASVFRLFGDTDSNIAAGGAIGVESGEKADPLVCFRSNDTSELLAATIAHERAPMVDRRKLRHRPSRAVRTRFCRYL